MVDGLTSRFEMGLALPTGREKVSRTLGFWARMRAENRAKRAEMAMSRLGPGPSTTRFCSPPLGARG